MDENKKLLNKKLDSLGWGLFFLLIGCLWLLPQGTLPDYAWLVGIGIIIVGINYIRYINNIKIDKISTLVALIAFAFALSDYLQVNIPVVPIIFILIGLSIILKVFRKA